MRNGHGAPMKICVGWNRCISYYSDKLQVTLHVCDTYVSVSDKARSLPLEQLSPTMLGDAHDLVITYNVM